MITIWMKPWWITLNPISDLPNPAQQKHKGKNQKAILHCLTKTKIFTFGCRAAMNSIWSQLYEMSQAQGNVPAKPPTQMYNLAFCKMKHSTKYTVRKLFSKPYFSHPFEIMPITYEDIIEETYVQVKSDKTRYRMSKKIL